MSDCPEYDRKIAKLSDELAKRNIRKIPGYILLMPNIGGDEEFCDKINKLAIEGHAERGY